MLGARERIIVATEQAMLSYQNGDMNRFFYWIGHASHNVEDSFSPAHARRSGSQYKTLTDVCIYDMTVPGVCTHAKIDTGDLIWSTSWACVFTTARNYECLKPEAQGAVRATAGYFRTVANIVKNGSDVRSALNAYFENSTDQYNGYHKCGSLR